MIADTTLLREALASANGGTWSPTGSEVHFRDDGPAAQPDVPQPRGRDHRELHGGGAPSDFDPPFDVDDVVDRVRADAPSTTYKPSRPVIARHLRL